MAACIFILAIFIFGVLRDQYGLRWSGWAFGDAQALNAAHHFVRNGIFTDFLLPNYGGNTQIGASYKPYVNYPQFINIPIFTALMHLGFTGAQFFKIFHVTLSAGFLYLLFRFFRKRLPDWAALFGLVFVGSAMVFLEFLDSFVQVYDEIFRAWFFLAILGYADRLCGPAKGDWKASLFLVGAFVAALLQSLNSYEYIMALQVFGLGYLLWRRILRISNAAILLMAPALGLAIHIAQVIAYEGVHDFVIDYVSRFLFRSYAHFPFVPQQILQETNYGLVLGYGFALSGVVSLGGLFIIAIFVGIKDAQYRKEISVVAALLLLSNISWYLLFPQSSLNFIVYMTKHLYPVLGFAFGATCYFLVISLFIVSRSLRWGMAALSGAWLLALFMTVALPATRHRALYLAKYPNLIGPRTYPLGTSTRDWITDIEFMRRLNSIRARGRQTVLIEAQKLHSYTSPGGPLRSPNALYSYYCNCFIASVSGADVLPEVLHDLKRRITQPTELFFASSAGDKIFDKLQFSREYSGFGGHWRVVKLEPWRTLKALEGKTNARAR